MGGIFESPLRIIDASATGSFSRRRQQCFSIGAFIIDLKVGRSSCVRRKGEAKADYAVDNLPNKILAAAYQTLLPDETPLAPPGLP